MSIGPTGYVGTSAAGVPLSQTRSNDNVRAAQDTAGRRQPVESGKDAEIASGVGQPTKDELFSDRDPDGRRLWERIPGRTGEAGPQEAIAQETNEQNDNNMGDTAATDVDKADVPAGRVEDIHGQSGNRLDLTG